MAPWSGLFGRRKDTAAKRRGDSGTAVPTGRKTTVGEGFYGSLSPYRSRTANVLKTLRSIPDKVDALDFLRKENPDVSMAGWNFVRLANVGHDMHFYGTGSRNKGRRMTEVEDAWRDFSARINELSNSGLDGLIDQLHASAFFRGAQAVEAEVNADRTDIVDVYAIMPQSVTWEYDKDRKRWVPYQMNGMQRVNLLDANFYWVPVDPDIDDPRGNLIMGSVLQAVDFQMQMLQDLQAVIHNQGWPRYDIKMLLDRVMASMPPQVKADPQKRQDYLKSKVDTMTTYFRDLEPDDSFVHYDDTEIKLSEGGSVTRSIDIRALGEMLDQQMMSGAKQLSVFMNRNSGVTESWGSVQFRIMVSGIQSIQRGSKRLMEEVARLWLRVNGIQARPHFEHKTIDWESEENRWRVKLLQQEFWQLSQLMGWVDGDKAAQEAVGVEKAVGEPQVSRNPNGGGTTNGLGDDSSGEDAFPANGLVQGTGRLLRLFGKHFAKGGD